MRKTTDTMSLAQRLAWLEGLSTLAVLSAAIALSLPPVPDPAALWGLAGRVALIVGICVVSFYFNDLYDFENPHDLPHLFGRLCRAIGWSALFLAFAYVLFPELMIRGTPASHALLVALSAVMAIRVTVYGLAKRAPFTERILLLGSGPLAREVAAQIATRRDLPARLIGVLADGPDGDGPAPRLGRPDDLAAAVRRHRPDRIVVALPDRRGTLPLAELLACRFRGIVVEEGTRAYERLMRRVAVEAVTPGDLIFADGFRVNRIQLAVKRALSIVVALAALAAAAPAMIVIAILIRLDSPGPACFVQERVGRHGRTFPLIKFRTMRVVEADTEGVVRDNASRVTRVGAYLRCYRLDEIPQFLNILRGDMSLVGPRPEIPHIVTAYSAAIPYYNLRHEVRPGLTGWAQVRAGYTMGIEETKRKLSYDLYYIQHMSVRFDVRILVDTVKFVMCGQRPG